MMMLMIILILILFHYTTTTYTTTTTTTTTGRIKGVKATMRDTTFQSSAYGKRENVETTIHGRVIFDILPYMFRNHKLSSYSLNSVSAEFLGMLLCRCSVV